MRLLFVCSRNKWRSRTAEKIYEGINGYAVKSAGTEAGARVKVTAGLVGWADLILCMEKKHVQRLREKFPEELADKQLICLHITDDYTFMDPELIELLQARLQEHLEAPGQGT
ncbi:MAG: protein tyrosine phosphatase [Opitutus sp.]|nr:protein tyrosine phosphatase [Opitutus sp.]